MHRGGEVMKTLVVTGGIGSGKSAVCSMLQELYGCGVYKADERVKMLYVEHPSLLDDIEHALGDKYRDADGTFLPKKLAARIFSDRQALETVETFVFPVLEEDYRKWSVKHAEDAFAVFESATILEKPQLKGFGDRTVLVDAPYEIRLARACRRDAVTEDAVVARMENQKLMNSISRGEIEAPVDAVILNDGTLEELKRQTVKIIEELLLLK